MWQTLLKTLEYSTEQKEQRLLSTKGTNLGKEDREQQHLRWRKVPGPCVKQRSWLGMLAHDFNPSTQEEEAGGPLSFKPAWSHSKTSKFKDNQKYGRPCLKGAGAEQL